MKSTGYILAFQVCIILGSCSWYCQATFIAELDKLKEYFNASKSDVANGEILFLNISKKWQEEKDKIIQSQIVSFYFKLFDTVKDKHIQASIDAIKEDLVVKFFNNSVDKLWDFLNITQISVNNQLVQRKAINELRGVLRNLMPAQRKRKRSPCCFGALARQNKNRPARVI
uniref:interferon gamma n=1 Tax=Jaculus jaculus TaxID=51337 RepID=UPI000333028A|nr:interferon gamma [Jaculus jaculus]